MTARKSAASYVREINSLTSKLEISENKCSDLMADKVTMRKEIDHWRNLHTKVEADNWKLRREKHQKEEDQERKINELSQEILRRNRTITNLEAEVAKGVESMHSMAAAMGWMTNRRRE